MSRKWFVTASIMVDQVLASPTQYESNDGFVLWQAADGRWFLRTKAVDGPTTLLSKRATFRTADRMIQEYYR